jgi:hypothetical protein
VMAESMKDMTSIRRTARKLPHTYCMPLYDSANNQWC